MKWRLALLLLSSVAAASPPARNFVVVIANNRSLTAGVEPLRYADDDGARWYELLKPTAERISLFTVFDAESQRVFGPLVAEAQPPTRAAIVARLAEYNRAMTEVRNRGEEPVLYVVIVGHGEIAPDGEGYVSLLDVPLRRSELFRDVIAPSTASFNHLIIDACNAYLLVARRGDDRGPSGAAAIKRYLADEDLDRYPGTGVLLATSRARATHEWSLYGGGIFSHELRSALTGAADVNGDGRVEYSEVSAWVAAANLRIDDPNARLDLYVRSPARDRTRALMDLTTAGFTHFLRLPSFAEGRFYLEDARGVRFADLNKAPGEPLLMALVDSPWYFLREEHKESRIVLDSWRGTLEAQPDKLVARTMVERGAIEQSFQKHLFEVPFGAGFYRGHVSSTSDPPVADPPLARFTPPPLDEAKPATQSELAGRLTAVKDNVKKHDIGHDELIEHLLPWADKRLAAGDLWEAARTIGELERHLQSPAR